MEEREDLIIIKGLTVYGKFGVSEQERYNPQRIVIDADLMTTPAGGRQKRSSAVSLAAECDDLTKTVDYGRVCHLIKDYVNEHSFLLIETLAERLAGHILSAEPLLSGIRLTIHKPEAPIGLPVTSVAIQIERRRRDIIEDGA